MPGGTFELGFGMRKRSGSKKKLKKVRMAEEAKSEESRGQEAGSGADVTLERSRSEEMLADRMEQEVSDEEVELGLGRGDEEFIQQLEEEWVRYERASGVVTEKETGGE